MTVPRAVVAGLMVLAVTTPRLAAAANHFVSNDGTWKMKDKSGQEMEGTCHTTIQEATLAIVNARANNDVIWVKNDVVCASGTNSTTYLARVSDCNVIMTIRGEDDDPTNGPIIDGKDTIRCVNFNKGSTLVGFSIQNGFAAGGRGGGVYLGNAGAVVSNCVVRDCLAEGAGGGIYSYGKCAKVYNCDILNNRTSGSNEQGGNGGGTFQAALFDCRIIGNVSGRASGTVSGAGGGGCADGSATRCLIAGNTAANTVRGASAGGGAYGTTLVGCLITNNYAYSNGGGVVNGSMVDCTNMFNVSCARGGGCFGTTLASNTVIACNSAAVFGGGVGLQKVGTARFVKCVITNNTCTTKDKDALAGCGIWSNDEGKGDEFERCLIAHNSGSGSAGGATGGTFRKCVIAYNTATGSGGVEGSWCYDCWIIGNAATNVTSASGHGGGASSSRLVRCLIANNSATGHGGGATGGVVSNCTVTGNISGTRTGMFGGALNDAKVYGSFITNNYNRAQSGGGCRECTTYNCVIAGNVNAESTASSTGRGGGGVCGGTHYNALIAGNISGSQGSGAAHATLYNCTVVGNIGTNSASDSVIGGYTTTQSCLVNTIIWGNKNAAGGRAGLVSVAAASNCCVEVTSVPAAWVACTNVNPRFENAAAGDYTPRARACRDVALEFDWMKDAFDIRSKDLAGRDRIIGKDPDMGAFEARIKGLVMIVR